MDAPSVTSCSAEAHAEFRYVRAPGDVWCSRCNAPVPSPRPGGPLVFVAELGDANVELEGRAKAGRPSVAPAPTVRREPVDWVVPWSVE